MLARIFFLTVIIFSVANAGQAPRDKGRAFLTVNDLRSICNLSVKEPEMASYCQGYISGVADSINDLHMARYGTGCWESGVMTPAQLVDFFLSMAALRPEFSNTAAASFAGIAIQAAAGCTRLKEAYKPVKE